MTMKDDAPNIRRFGAAVAIAAIAIPCAVGFAQEMDSTSRESPGMPRNIIPMQDMQPESKPEAPKEMPPNAPVVRSTVPSPVQVGELSTIEGPVAGILDAANGGLGSTEW